MTVILLSLYFLVWDINKIDILWILEFLIPIYLIYSFIKLIDTFYVHLMESRENEEYLQQWFKNKAYSYNNKDKRAK